MEETTRPVTTEPAGALGEGIEANDCDFCARAPRAEGELICAGCASVGGVAQLYLPRVGKSPEWARHLRRLAARAAAGVPLFDDLVRPSAYPSAEGRTPPGSRTDMGETHEGYRAAKRKREGRRRLARLKAVVA